MQFLHLLRHYPFIRIIIPFILGILTGLQVFFSDYLIHFAALVCFCALILVHKFNTGFGKKWLYGLFLNLTFFFLGWVVLNFYERINRYDVRYTNHAAVFEAEVIKTPAEKEKTVGVILRIRQIKTDTVISSKTKVIAYIEKDNRSITLKVGDVLMVKSFIKEITGPTNPYEFDYRRRMKWKNISLTTYINSQSWQKTGYNSSIFAIASKIRSNIFSVYDSCGIKGDELAVLSALTLGYKDHLSDELTQYYAASGAMHILAVSGLHVGIIFLLTNHLLFFLKRNRTGKILRLILILVSLWFFAAIAGFSPSVSRAAFMFSVIQFGKTIKKPPEIYNIIAFSAFVLLLINPFQIADVGFQLSYLAVTGIVFFQPRIYNLFYIRNRIADYFWQLVSVSLAAQLVTTPLSIGYFHYFPSLFWLTNIFIIPLAATIIYGAVLLVVIFYLHLPYLFFGKILNLVLTIQNYLIFKIQSIPFAMIENLDISSFQIILYFIILIFITLFIIKRKGIYLICSLTFFTCFLIIHSLKVIRIENQNKLVVFNTGKNTLISMVNGRNAVFISDYDESVILSDLFQVKNFIVKCGIRRTESIQMNNPNDSLFLKNFSYKTYDNNIYVTNGKYNGIILKNTDLINGPDLKPLSTNFIILTSETDILPGMLKDYFNTEWVILDSPVSRKYRLKWLSSLKDEKTRIHSVADSGAFELTSFQIKK